MKFDADALDMEAWNRDEVGIWYGAWTADDWKLANQSPDPIKYLSELPRQKAVGWDNPAISAAAFKTIKRFCEIRETDWIWVFFNGGIHFAHPSGPLQRADGHPLDRRKELFKTRRIEGKKSFQLSLLPDCFQLLRPAGRANVFELHGGRPFLEILANSADERG